MQYIRYQGRMYMSWVCSLFCRHLEEQLMERSLVQIETGVKPLSSVMGEQRICISCQLRQDLRSQQVPKQSSFENKLLI